MTCDGCGQKIGEVVRLGDQAPALCAVCSLREQQNRQAIEAQAPWNRELAAKLEQRVTPKPVTIEQPDDSFVREPKPATGTDTIFRD